MTFDQKNFLAERLQAAEKSARADRHEFVAKAQEFFRLAQIAKEQENLLADARFQLWTETEDF